MRGFSHDDYMSEVKRTRIMGRCNFLWITGLELVNVHQEIAVLKAFNEAVLHDSTELMKMDILVTGTWKSSHGSGTFTTSSARKEEIWFKTDHNYSFHGEHTVSVTLPPVGGSPYPQAYATSGSTSNEKGLYIVSSPNKILLLSDNGRSRFAQYYKNEYVLMVDGGGVYGK